MHLQKK